MSEPCHSRDGAERGRVQYAVSGSQDAEMIRAYIEKNMTERIMVRIAWTKLQCALNCAASSSTDTSKYACVSCARLPVSVLVCL